MDKIKLLYVYRQRIPLKLRELVLSFIPKDEFSIKMMNYSASLEKQKGYMNWADVVLFAPGRKLSSEVMEAAKNVKLMQLWSSGFDKFNIEDSIKFEIPVANNGGGNAVSVAEHTILLMLAVYKWLPDSHRRTVEGRWEGNSHGIDMFLLSQKVLGIIGFGNIGKEVARRAKGFGMRILYNDLTPASKSVEKEYGANFVDLNNLLEESDIVSLHLHNTEDTRGIIGKRELERMKDSAVLINVSRAQLVDYDELYIQLSKNKLGGCGLDVYYDEPTTGKELLLNHPKVVATPHMAGSTRDIYRQSIENALINFRRVKNGQEPYWVVNGVNCKNIK